MAMATFPHSIFSLFTLLLLAATPSHSATCSSPSPTLKTTRLYKTCLDLPALRSTLHWTYIAGNQTLSVAFTASPSSSEGWVSWGINPTAAGMAGTQALLAFRKPNGAVSVKTFNISSYSEITEGNLSFIVHDKKAEVNPDGSITIFAAVACGGGKVNQVWQVGPGVDNGFPLKHDFNKENLQTTGVLDLTYTSGGGQASEKSSAGTGVSKRNIHGILNAISWGILFPIGAIIARYLRSFECADPGWFYVHAICQISAYALGVAGWATGLQLGSQSIGIVYEGHRCIGIALFCLATVQITALFLRPKKDHKYRVYWNIYHHSIGYAIVVLGIFNVFKGLQILQPDKKWRSLYVTSLLALAAIAVFLEAFTWIVVLKKKKKNQAAPKPYA